MNTHKLNRNQLKYLAIAAMLIDHIAWAFVPLAGLPGQLMHFAGRLTGPTMAFFLAEGYLHTRSLKKYGLRLGVLALVSWPAFSFFETGRPFVFAFGVVYTLFLGFLAILVWDKGKMAAGWKIVLTVLLCLASSPGDWPYFDVLWPLFLWLYREEPEKKWRSYWIILLCSVVLSIAFGGFDPVWVSAYTLGELAVPLILRFGYSGLPGSKKPFHKWAFYVFYPAHLLILGLARHYL